MGYIFNHFSFHCNLKIVLSFYKLFIISWIAFIVFVFRKFVPLSYGVIPLSAKEVLKLRWNEEWDFIIHKT
jgi:dolichyl-phosphate-mannose-protein mannosyltransferase